MTSSSSESIPLTKLSPAQTPRPSDSYSREEEAQHLLNHYDDSSPVHHHDSPRTGALWQIAGFFSIGLLIALASGAFAYTLRTRTQTDADFLHAPLPGMKNPSLLRYFGGMGPYIGGEYAGIPRGCKVTQVHMISRHGERYPTAPMGHSITQFAQNVTGKGGFHKRLSFLNEWRYEDWIYAPETQFDQETLTGPAAGSLRMFTLGNELRTRYSDLWGYGDVPDQGIKIWAGDFERVIDSARYFADGFFGVNNSVEVELIPETRERYGNSLTTTYPHSPPLKRYGVDGSSSCSAFMEGEYNASYGFTVAANAFQSTFLPKTVERLNKFSDDYRITEDDVLAMSQLCPFQINSWGESPFCDIFTEKEWKYFNYARDLATYYASGPGNPFGKVMGQPWVGAVLDLLTRNTSTNHNLYFSFSHDTDIVPIIPALGLFPTSNPNPLPWDIYDKDRVFWTTSIVPMGGHIIIERLQCGEDTKVRVIVNGRTHPVPGCTESGSKRVDESEVGVCGMEEFERVVSARWDKRFCEVCAPGEGDCVDGISFFES